MLRLPCRPDGQRFRHSATAAATLSRRILTGHKRVPTVAHTPSLIGRIDIDLDDPEFVRTIASLHIWPLTLDVCRAFSQIDFRGDPADEIIAATSVVHRVPLITRDRRIRASRRVPIVR